MVWSDEAYAHVRESHPEVTPALIHEALDDPDLLEYDPDPTSKSGLGVRCIGVTLTHGVVAVVGFHDGDVVRGATAHLCHKGPFYRAYMEGVQ